MSLAVPVVVFVCTANLCRSPIAEGLSHVGAFADLRWRTVSAGTSARPGLPAHPLAVAALTAHGADLSTFATRPLAGVALEQVSLVLVAEPDHRRAVVHQSPAVGGRTFLLRQFARLAATVPARPAGRGVSELVDAVRSARQLVAPFEPHRDVLADPIGGGPEVFAATAAAVAADLTTIARAALPSSS